MSGMLNPTKTVVDGFEWPEECEERPALAPGAELRGRVVDTYGKPLDGLPVFAVQGELGGATFTDAKGRFAFTVAEGGGVLLGVCGRTYAAPADQAVFEVVVDK